MWLAGGRDGDRPVLSRARRFPPTVPLPTLPAAAPSLAAGLRRRSTRRFPAPPPRFDGLAAEVSRLRTPGSVSQRKVHGKSWPLAVDQAHPRTAPERPSGHARSSRLLCRVAAAVSPTRTCGCLDGLRGSSVGQSRTLVEDGIRASVASSMHRATSARRTPGGSAGAGLPLEMGETFCGRPFLDLSRSGGRQRRSPGGSGSSASMSAPGSGGPSGSSRLDGLCCSLTEEPPRSAEASRPPRPPTGQHGPAARPGGAAVYPALLAGHGRAATSWQTWLCLLSRSGSPFVRAPRAPVRRAARSRSGARALSPHPRGARRVPDSCSPSLGTAHPPAVFCNSTTVKDRSDQPRRAASVGRDAECLARCGGDPAGDRRAAAR